MTIQKRVCLAVKRFLDFGIAALLLILLSPVLLITGLLVLITLGRPVFYIQDRIGYQGRVFPIIKFRTMSQRTNAEGLLMPDQDRLSGIGRFLRSTSLDELPELINVLRGEMSLVGPRPLLMKYRDLYNEEQWRRHDMPPGMAGPVVARGRNMLKWPDKFDLDIWYVDNWSLKLDIILFFESVVSAIRRKGISAQGHATMPTFTGDE